MCPLFYAPMFLSSWLSAAAMPRAKKAVAERQEKDREAPKVMSSAGDAADQSAESDATSQIDLLFRYVCRGDSHGVSVVLEKSREPKRAANWLDADGLAPLHRAAMIGNICIIRQLLDASADQSLHCSDGWMPLHYAAYAGNKSVICVLLKAGGDINARTTYEETPLIVAACHGRSHILALLMESKCNTLLTDHVGRTAADQVEWFLAHGGINPELPKTLQQLKQQMKAQMEDPYMPRDSQSSPTCCPVCLAKCVLFHCSGCRLTWYCSKVCQKKAFSSHRFVCARAKEVRNAIACVCSEQSDYALRRSAAQ
jgi:hypothetical protein